MCIYRRRVAAAMALFVPPLLLIILVVRAALTSGTNTPAAAHPPEQGFVHAVWQKTPLTQEIDALLELPNQPGHVIAGTSSGVWHSNDGGRSWTQDRGALTGLTVTALAASRSGTVYAGGGDGRVYALRQGGRWQPISPEFGSSAVFALAVSPDSGALLAGANTGIFRAGAGGAAWHWQHVLSTGLSSVASLIFAPWTPHTVFAAVFGEPAPVRQSSDDGRTWHPSSPGLPSTLPTIQLLAPAGNPRRILLTTMGSGVWQSDGHGPWHDISAGLPQHHAMPIAALPSGTLFAGTMEEGVYYLQGGGTWQRAGSALAGGQYVALSMVVSHGADPAVLAGTSSGLFRLDLR